MKQRCISLFPAWWIPVNRCPFVKPRPIIRTISLSIALLSPMAFASANRPPKNKAVDLTKIYGKIQFVSRFPDFKVQIVDSFADLHVQKVTAFPDAPGKWQIVDSFPDFKIQIVNRFPDFKIKYVESFPGLAK